MSKYRHRPTVVDAIPWNGTQAALKELRALGLSDYRLEPASTQGDLDVLVIKTLEREEAVALIGDWVIKGTQQEWYAVKPDVFAACYEAHTGALA